MRFLCSVRSSAYVVPRHAEVVVDEPPVFDPFVVERPVHLVAIAVGQPDLSGQSPVVPARPASGVPVAVLGLVLVAPVVAVAGSFGRVPGSSK